MEGQRQYRFVEVAGSYRYLKIPSCRYVKPRFFYFSYENITVTVTDCISDSYVHATPKWDTKNMFSIRESMRYDFSQICPDSGRYKGVLKVGVREFFFRPRF